MPTVLAAAQPSTSSGVDAWAYTWGARFMPLPNPIVARPKTSARSEEHTSELQSHSDLVCRLLLEKKKKKNKAVTSNKENKYLRKSNLTCTRMLIHDKRII